MEINILINQFLLQIIGVFTQKYPTQNLDPKHHLLGFKTPSLWDPKHSHPVRHEIGQHRQKCFGKPWQFSCLSGKLKIGFDYSSLPELLSGETMCYICHWLVTYIILGFTGPYYFSKILIK